MKRLTAVLVVLVMFGVCATSFGNYFLIYNVSATVKGVDTDTELKATVPMKGYLVLDINDSCDLDPHINDANLILYGKNPDKVKVYVKLNDSDSNNFLNVNIWRSGEYFFLQLEGNDYFDFEGLMVGKMKAKKIGFDEPNDVASSIKGVLIVREGMLLDASQDISGTTNISATLWGAATKWVNGSNDQGVPWTQDEIINGDESEEKEGLVQTLERKGYDAVVLP